MTTVDLTPNDTAVLTALFDPESAASSSTAPQIDPTLPPDAHTPPTLLPSLRATELRAIRLAESNDLPAAHTLLSNLTLSNPTYASAYNNLAQVLRMMSAPPAEILVALSTAIDLAAPEPGAAVSKERANLLGQAYTQRGALLWGLFKSGGEAVGMGREQLESAASRDFYEGGRYGNGVGREMAVRTNPYARLCGAIVKEALTREYVGGR